MSPGTTSVSRAQSALATLCGRATCLDKRLSRKDPERGAVVYRYELFNQRDEIVFECVSTNLV